MLLNIPIIHGTVRPGNYSHKAALLVESVGKAIEDVTTFVINPGMFNMPLDGNNEDLKDPKYTKIVEEADGFFIVMPEYNHGYPGSLKRMLDQEYDLYYHKAAALAGVSDGNWGGARGTEMLMPVLRRLGLSVVRGNLYFPKVKELFDDNGNLVKDQALYQKAVRTQWNELIWLAKALKTARQNQDPRTP